MYNMNTFSSMSGYPVSVKSNSRSSIVPPPSSVSDCIPNCMTLSDCRGGGTCTVRYNEINVLPIEDQFLAVFS